MPNHVPPTGIRRSRRIAEKRGDACTEQSPPPMPSAPRLEADTPQFDGPRPAWVTGQDTRSDTLPASPKRGAGGTEFEPRVLPPLSQHAIKHMPMNKGTLGMGLSFPKHTSNKSLTDTTQSKSSRSPRKSRSFHHEGERSCEDSSDFAAIPTPLAPRIGTLESGRFSPHSQPENDGLLVSEDHEEAKVPPRHVSSRMQHSASIRREAPIRLDTMPSDGEVIGLGIDIPEIQDPVEGVTASIKGMSLEKAPLRERSTNAGPKRVPFGEKRLTQDTLRDKKMQSSFKISSQNKAEGKSTASTSKFVDENGRPISYTIPTKRYMLPSCRKARSSMSQSAMQRDRVMFSVSYQHAHNRTTTQPSIHINQHSRRTYALR